MWSLVTKLSCWTALLLCVTFTSAEDASTDAGASSRPAQTGFPTILAQKRILKNEIVTGDRVEIEIELYNIGSKPAKDVIVEDSNWDASIQYESGSSRHHFPFMRVHETAKFSYVIRVPNVEGDYVGNPAKITYHSGEDMKTDGASDESKADDDAKEDDRVFTSYSTQIYEDAELPYDRLKNDDTQARGMVPSALYAVGKLRVLSLKSIEQKNAFQLTELVIMFVLFLVPVGLPYYFYHIRSKELEVITGHAKAQSPKKSA